MANIISSLTFEDLVHTEKRPILIDVYHIRCQPCLQMAPTIDAMAAEFLAVLKIVKLDRDEADANGGTQNPLIKFLAKQGIQGVPALLLFEGGEFKGVLMGGPRPRSNILEWLEKTLGRNLSVTNTSQKLGPGGRSPGL
ncbi:MAG: hypothetical protein HY052_01730 [Proteobacteria bacterium]|nr:hypothetical protein [Pseudomonadota bacterium]